MARLFGVAIAVLTNGVAQAYNLLSQAICLILTFSGVCWFLFLLRFTGPCRVDLYLATSQTVDKLVHDVVKGV